MGTGVGVCGLGVRGAIPSRVAIAAGRQAGRQAGKQTYI